MSCIMMPLMAISEEIAVLVVHSEFLMEKCCISNLFVGITLSKPILMIILQRLRIICVDQLF